MATRYQVMCKEGDTDPDTSATDVPYAIGPQHDSKAAAEAWMEAKGHYTFGNREYYEKYWVVEVD